MADMANYWMEKGWQVTLATWSDSEIADFYDLHPDIRRVWLTARVSNRSIFGKLRAGVASIRKLRTLILEMRPDAVLSFIDTSNVLTLLATLNLKTRVIVSERIHAAHYLGISRIWRVLRRALYARASAVVAQTHDAAHWIGRQCGVQARVIANPLRHLPDRSQQKELLVLAVGRLARQKGFDLLLRAFALIHGDFPGWRLVIVGSGPEQSALVKLRDELRMTTRIEFNPPVKDIESWMARASLVVQPSRFEGFPNAVLEAMGMGAAVISANCPSGPAEIIQDGINGCLVPVEDVNALAHAMAHLMRQPEIRSHLGNEAKKVRESYRQDKIMAQWEQCLMPHSRAAY